MAEYVLYTYPNNPRAQKALIAAQYTGTKVSTPDFKMGTDNKTEAFLAKNPAGKVPVLETPNGPIFESNAILRYIGKLSPAANLSGKSFHEAALVEQWLDFVAFEVAPPTNIWLWPILGIIKNDEQAVKGAKADVMSALTILNNHLASTTFFVGECITLADIAMVCTLRRLFELVLPANVRATLPHLTRWFLTCVNQPQFSAVLGSIKLAETEAVAETKKEEKKAEKKTEKKDEPVAVDAAPKKAKNPLDLLPRSSMNLDSVKKTFSNLDFEEAQKKFWAEFDSEGYSVYECKYKYNEENTVYFMTCNLVGGFIQRVDPLRKYGFGNLALCGPDEGPFTIMGAWLFRGDGIPAEMTECTDSEYYEFTKLDATTEQGRARWNELTGADFIDGLTVHERKCFK